MPGRRIARMSAITLICAVQAFGASSAPAQPLSNRPMTLVSPFAAGREHRFCAAGDRPEDQRRRRDQGRHRQQAGRSWGDRRQRGQGCAAGREQAAVRQCRDFRQQRLPLSPTCPTIRSGICAGHAAVLAAQRARHSGRPPGGVGRGSGRARQDQAGRAELCRAKRRRQRALARRHAGQEPPASR